MAFLRTRSVYCIPKEEFSLNDKIAFSAVCLTTASLSAYGAILQLRLWYRQLEDYESRRVPSSNPAVVFSLALADLFACIGVLGLSIFFIAIDYPIYNSNNLLKPKQPWYWYIGTPIEAFTMFSYIASYMWTLVYSVDICLQVHNGDRWVSMWTYQIICWCAPLWLVACGEYGFIGNTVKTDTCSTSGNAVLHYMVCFVPLLFVTTMLPIVYIVAYRRIQQNIRGVNATYTNTERQILSAIKSKFFFTVLVFMFCWILNVGDGFHDLKNVINFNPTEVESHSHLAVWMVEAVVNPLQGFLNCLVYGHGKKFITCCRRKPSIYGSSNVHWADTTPTSENSESFLINSQDIIEHSRQLARPLLSGEPSSPNMGGTRSTSPFQAAKMYYVPKLLGEPRT